jgi:tRNA G46 methylase TrmB
MIRVIQSYRRVVGVHGLVSAIKGKITKTPTLLKIDRPDIKFPFYLRVPSSDVETFEQIFIRQDYNFDVKKSPKTIVDAGANIGLASLYFASKFPNSNIVAIEPEESNFELLKNKYWTI